MTKKMVALLDKESTGVTAVASFRLAKESSEVMRKPEWHHDTGSTLNLEDLGIWRGEGISFSLQTGWSGLYKAGGVWGTA